MRANIAMNSMNSPKDRRDMILIRWVEPLASSSYIQGRIAEMDD